MAAALIPPETSIAEVAEDRLAELEGVIERGLDTFLAVGFALGEINARRLYRQAGYRSFGAYVSERWAMSRPRAYELMRASRVSEALGADEQIASARALSELSPVLIRHGAAATRQAWAKVKRRVPADRKPTAMEVRATLNAEGVVDGVDRGPLDEAGRLMTSLGRYLEAGYHDRPLEIGLRPLAAHYANRARTIATAFDALAQGGLVKRGSLTRPGPEPAPPSPGEVWCDDHGRVRRADGVCAACGVRDLTRAT